MKTRITRYLLVIASVLTLGYARAAEPIAVSKPATATVDVPAKPKSEPPTTKGGTLTPRQK